MTAKSVHEMHTKRPPKEDGLIVNKRGKNLGKQLFDREYYTTEVSHSSIAA